MDWEGRLRTFGTVLPTAAMTDGRVLEAVAALMEVPSNPPAAAQRTTKGISLGTGDVAAIRRELAAMPAKQRRGSKVQGPTALRFR